MIPREYYLSQVRDVLALSSARAVDLFLLILLQTGWSIGKMGQRLTHSHTHTLTHRAKYRRLAQYGTGLENWSDTHSQTHRQTHRAKYRRPAQYGAGLEKEVQ